MYRRSSRLMSSGYYISDEKSDLSPVTAVSYRENLEKVFKKRARKHKASSHIRTPAITDAPCDSPELPVAVGQCDGLSPSTLRVKGQTPVTKSTVFSGYGSRISSAFFGLMDSVSSRSRKMHVTALGNKACSGHMRKACSLFVLLLILFFCCLVNYQKITCPDTCTNPVPNQLTPELQHTIEKCLTDCIKEQDAIRLTDRRSCSDCGYQMADKMTNFALETQGARVISTGCSKTYCLFSLFGFRLWYPSESPGTVIQGSSVLSPGQCWPFHGNQGTLVISLSHPIRITHVTMDHLPVYNSPSGRINSAPKDFEVCGMKTDTEEGKLLGTFTYDKNGESAQIFKLPNPSDVVYSFVELRVLTNWGHADYTCLYGFRVHGQKSST